MWNWVTRRRWKNLCCGVGGFVAVGGESGVNNPGPAGQAALLAGGCRRGMGCGSGHPQGAPVPGWRGVFSMMGLLQLGWGVRERHLSFCQWPSAGQAAPLAGWAVFYIKHWISVSQIMHWWSSEVETTSILYVTITCQLSPIHKFIFSALNFTLSTDVFMFVLLTTRNETAYPLYDQL